MALMPAGRFCPSAVNLGPSKPGSTAKVGEPWDTNRTGAGFTSRILRVWADTTDLKAYQTENAVQIPVALDATGNLFRSYYVTSVPTVVVLGPDGEERHRASGGDIAALLMDETRAL
jgi:hypothetical protein